MHCVSWFRLVLLLMACILFADRAVSSQPADSAPAAADPSHKGDSNASADSEKRLPELLPIEQLVLVLSNATGASGDRQEVLVFLGRGQQRGWEAIGVDDLEELRSHWRTVASRILAECLPSDLDNQQKERVDLAVELSITQFLRLYIDLRSDFLSQPDQRSRLAVLANDDRYDRLRQLGREGLYTADSLLAKVIQGLTEDDKDTSR